MKKSINTIVALSVVLAVSAFGSAQAASLWNFDFSSSNGSMSGAAQLGSAGDAWNVYNSGDVDGSYAAVDSAGGNPIGFSFSAPGGNLFGFNPSGSPNPAELMDGFGSSVNSGSGSAVSQLAFTFSGLVANTDYDVVAYGASQDGTDRGTFFFGPVNSPILGYTDGSSTDITSARYTSWDMFTISTDASGSFTINTNYNSGSSAQGPVNGFQVQGPAPAPVPEPASIVVLLIGLALIAVGRRSAC